MRTIGEGLWCVEHDLRLGGMAFGTRTSVVRLPSGGLLLVGPGDLSDDHAAAIDALGPVERILAPNLFHHLFLAQARSRWPDARLEVAQGLPEKISGVPHDAVCAPQDDLGTVRWLRVQGAPKLGEHVLHHPGSGTVILTDLCFNFIEDRGWWTRFQMGLFDAWGKLGPSRYARFLMDDKAAVKRSVDQILEWDFDRIVVSHGEVLETGAKEQLRAAFAAI